MNANVKAIDLSSELFSLVNKFKELCMKIQANETAEFDDRFEASGQADTAACALAAAYEQIVGLQLFWDARQDNPEFSFPI